MNRLTWLALAWLAATAGAGATEYLALVAKSSATDPAWKNVGDKLAADDFILIRKLTLKQGAKLVLQLNKT